MIHKEPLNGGLVQTRHATLLRPGELQQADDCILRPGDPAIHKAPGRTLLGPVSYSSSYSTTTNSTTLLTSSSLFGTAIASVTVTANSTIISKTNAFGSVSAGQTVVGTGIPSGTTVYRKIDNTTLELSKAATADGPATITYTDLKVGTYIYRVNVPDGTRIATITDASNITMDTAATGTSSGQATYFSDEVQLRVLNFDEAGTNLLCTKSAGIIKTAPLVTASLQSAPTFTSRITNLSLEDDSQLDTIQFGNRHIIITGKDLPRIIYYNSASNGDPTITSRTIGMLPVKEFVGVAAVAGSWNVSDLFKDGLYYFLVTEVLIIGDDDEVESTFSGDPKGVEITDYANQGIRVTYMTAASTPVNDGLYGRNTATHWRVYMAPRQDPDTPAPDLATFQRVSGNIPISTSSIVLTDGNPYQIGYAKTVGVDAGAGTPLFPYGSSGAVSATANQSQTCTLTSGSTTITSAAAFGTVTPGMSVLSAANSIPYGTVVVSVASTSSLTITKPATLSGSETLYFGNSSSNLDGSMARCPANPSTSVFRGSTFQDFGMVNQGGFSSGTITGIVVDIIGAYQSDKGRDWGFQVAISRDNTTFSTSKLAKFGRQAYRSLSNRNARGVIRLGGEFDNWGITGWVPGDFVNGASKFTVRVRKNHAYSSSFGEPQEIYDHYIDSIAVTVYAGGNQIVLGERFPTVTISDGLENSFSEGAFGPPPVASTGDIFNGAVILNDTANPSRIVSSYPDELDAYPSVYSLSFQSKSNDEVTFIRRLQNICVVGCKNSIKRLNYFPNETDADFSRGRCYEDIATDHGIVGPRAGTTFDIPGQGTLLAYLSRSGLRVTDGITSRFLNEDLNWSTLIAPAYIHKSILVAWPKLSLLALYYAPVGGDERNTKCMYFSYHPTHLKEGFKLPAVGPVSFKCGGADISVIDGAEYLLTGGSWDGYSYVEDSGTTDLSGGTIDPAIKTRKFFMADLGLVGRMERVFLVADAAGNSTTGAFTGTITRQNYDEASTDIETVTGDTVTGGLIKLFADNLGETLSIKISKSGATQTAAMRLHYLGYEASPLTQDTTE